MVSGIIRHRYAGIALLSILLVLGGLMSSLLPCITMPPGRVCTAMHGYSSDYVQFVSYIKEGMYGRYHMYFRSFPPVQPATPIHWEYILFGILAAPFGLEPTAVYHIVRALFGILLVVYVYRLYVILFGSRRHALLTTALAFISSGIGYPIHTQDGWRIHIVNYFSFFMSSAQRASDRPHYLVGSILFLIMLERIFAAPATAGFLIVLIAGSALTAIIHISSGSILGGIGVVLFCMTVLTHGRNAAGSPALQRSLAVILGTLLGAGIMFAYIRIYSRVSDVWLDKLIYSGPITMESVFLQILSFGPTLWIGLPALGLTAFLYPRQHDGRHVILFSWAAIQMFFFLVGHRMVGSDNVRFIQSLYFIPLAYGTAWAILRFSERFGTRIFVVSMITLLIISLPAYGSHIHDDILSTTDFRDYSLFAYPSVQEYNAYKFLDRSSPRESTVMSNYEASNHILMYSHNRTLGNDQGWSAGEGSLMQQEVANWFRGSLDTATAYAYLKKYDVKYVYYGYQERIGRDISAYPFLTEAYRNPEVTIYRVR